MNRDIGLIFFAKIVRTFCYGALGLFIPLYLTQLGFDEKKLGLALTLILLANAFWTFFVRYPAEKYGPRLALVFLSLLIPCSSVLFLISHNPWFIVLAAMLGNLAVVMGEAGPFFSLEQVMLTRIASSNRLIHLLSHYNLLGYVCSALGAATISAISLSPPALFIIFFISGILQGGAYAFLGSHSPGPTPPTSPTFNRPSTSSPLVKRLAALFALDSLAGGFIIQSFLVYWFHVRFQMDMSSLGWVFFGTQLVTGLSLLLAPPLSRRLGLVPTMVFSHLISNLFLIAIPFCSHASTAVALLILRHLLSQIDVPTRQSFLMLAVNDAERESAVSLTNTSRILAQSLSPSLGGWVMHLSFLSAPFLIGGGLKILYDMSLYALIRKTPLRNNEMST